MKTIPRLKEGEEYPSAFSAEFMNMIVDTCNAVRNMRGIGGVRVYMADSGYVISSSGSYSNGSGSFASGSSVVYGRSDVWL